MKRRGQVSEPLDEDSKGQQAVYAVASGKVISRPEVKEIRDGLMGNRPMTKKDFERIIKKIAA